MISKALERFDENRNGNISRAELEIAEQVLEIELREEKTHAQRKMVWIMVIMMIVITILIFTPIISDNRIKVLSDLISVIFLGFCGTISAFFGVSAWMSNTATNRPYGYYKGYQPDNESGGILRNINNIHNEEGEGDF